MTECDPQVFQLNEGSWFDEVVPTPSHVMDYLLTFLEPPVMLPVMNASDTHLVRSRTLIQMGLIEVFRNWNMTIEMWSLHDSLKSV